MTEAAAELQPHPQEPHDEAIGSRLNWLRAGVLGANDGIVSTAGIVIGVAAATTDRAAILTAGVAGLAAGAMSMAAGEYVSVSTQRDTERALIAKEKRELREMPEEELAELTGIYEAKGLPRELAHEVAVALTRNDALAAHAGALLPLLAMLLMPVSIRIPVTAVSVAVSLVITGWVSASLGKAPTRPAIIRNVLGGTLAMAVTYGIGLLVGTQL